MSPEHPWIDPECQFTTRVIWAVPCTLPDCPVITTVEVVDTGVELVDVEDELFPDPQPEIQGRVTYATINKIQPHRGRRLLMPIRHMLTVSTAYGRDRLGGRRKAEVCALVVIVS
jgi:hypothetical protein